MENILGVREWNGHLCDRWWFAIARELDRVVSKAFGNVEVEMVREVECAERRTEIIRQTATQSSDYRDTLTMLLRERSELTQFLLRRTGRDPADTRKKRIRIALWHSLGNLVPYGELNPSKVTGILRDHGMAFRRVRGGRGWYLGDRWVAKTRAGALEQLETSVTVNRLDLV